MAIGMRSVDEQRAAEAEMMDRETLPLDERTIRAAGEAMVSHEYAPGMYHVYSEAGEEHTVDPDLEACTCSDAFYRDPDGGCKHVRRCKLAIGWAALPEAGNYHVDPVLAKRLEDPLGGRDA